MRRLSLVALLGMALGTGVLAAEDEPDSVEAMLEALGGGGDGQLTRGIVIRERDEHEEVSIDLDIEFEFDSSQLTDGAVEKLSKLATVLEHPTLVNNAFGIVGHTDAKGSAAYNLRLSVARADRVSQYLQDNGVDGRRLGVEGKGETELRYANRPDDPANRRVQIINRGRMPAEW